MNHLVYRKRARNAKSIKKNHLHCQKTQNWKIKIQNWESKIRTQNSKSEIQNQKSKPLSGFGILGKQTNKQTNKQDQRKTTTMTTTPPVYDDHHHHSTKCSYSSKQHCPAHRQSSRQQNKTAKHIKTLENIDPAPTGPDLCARCVPSFSCSSPTARGLRSSSRARVPVPCATSSALTECKS